MADLLVLPIIILAFYKIQYKRDGFFEDYLSLENSQMLRGFFAIDLIIFHLCMPQFGVSHKLLGIFSGEDAVKIFFFLSGYGLIKQLSLKGKTYLDGFFSKRLVKLIVPFIISAILYAVMFRVKHFYYEAGELTLKTMLEQFFSNGYTIVYNSWFLIELAILYLVFAVSFKIAKGDTEKGIAICSVLTALVMLGFWWLCYHRNWLFIWSYSTYAFAFGIIWGGYERQLLAFIKKHFYIIVSVCFIAAAVLLIIFRTYLLPVSDGIYNVIKNYVIGPFIILGVVLGAMKLKLGCPVWKFLGEISFETYLLHGIFYTLLREHISNSLLFCVAVLAGTIALSVPVHYLDKLIVNGWLTLINKIQGNKKESKA